MEHLYGQHKSSSCTYDLKKYDSKVNFIYNINRQDTSGRSSYYMGTQIIWFQMSNIRVYRGTLVHSTEEEHLLIKPNQAIGVDENGKVSD